MADGNFPSSSIGPFIFKNPAHIFLEGLKQAHIPDPLAEGELLAGRIFMVIIEGIDCVPCRTSENQRDISRRETPIEEEEVRLHAFLDQLAEHLRTRLLGKTGEA